MLDILTRLFDPSGFVPRSLCGEWTPELIWLHNASDALIWLSYLAIPMVLLYFVRRRRDLPFSWMFLLFGLFIVSDIFDSADGQLARLRGASTRLGRALDGASGSLRFINLYFHLIYRLIHTGYWWPGAFLLVAAAGLAHTYQSAAVDFVRNAFLSIGIGNRGELDLPEDLDPHQPKTLLERFGARVYRDYVLRQSQLFPRSVKLIRLLRRGGGSVPEEFRAEYRVRQSVVLPLCTWLGQNIRFLLLGVTALTAHVSAFLWIEAVWMSLLLVVLLWIHEWNATALGGLLDVERNGYARVT